MMATTAPTTSDTIITTTICVRCKLDQPVAAFDKNRSSPNGLQAYCRACMKIYRLHRAAINAAELLNPTPPKLTKICKLCNHDLPKLEFGKNSFRHDGLQVYCRACMRSYLDDRLTGLTAFLNQLHSMSMNRARNRTGAARQEHTLTQKSVLDMWLRQQGCCYYSGLPMTHTPSTEFMASLERLDPALGYTTSNTVLCILELNSMKQWTVEKIERLITEVDLVHAETDIDADLSSLTATRNPSAPHLYQIANINGVEYHECKTCHEHKPLEAFGSGPQSACRTCVRERKRQFRQTALGRVRGAVVAAKHHSISMAAAVATGKRVGDIGFTLTVDEAVALLQRQRGRCAYSGVRMRYAPNSEWLASLERIDSERDYQIDNVLFVCVEFNVTERSAGRRSETNTGSQDGWDKPKVDKLLAAVRAKYNKPIP